MSDELQQWQLENASQSICDWLDGPVEDIIRYVLDRATKADEILTLTDAQGNAFEIRAVGQPVNAFVRARQRSLIMYSDEEIEFLVKLTWRNYTLANQHNIDVVSAYAEYALYNNEYSRRWQQMTPQQRVEYLSLRKGME